MSQQPLDRQQPFEQPQWGQQVPPHYPQQQQPQNGWPTPNSLPPQGQLQWTSQQPGAQAQPPSYQPSNSPQPQQQRQNSMTYAMMQSETERGGGNRAMQRNRRRFGIFLLILSVVLLVGGGLIFVYVLRTSPPTGITVVWQASTNSFTQQDQQDIQTALKSVLLASNSGRIVGHEFTIIDAQRQDDWAIFSANERVSHDAQPIAGEPIFFLGHRQATTWTAWKPGSLGFCNQLKQIPDTLLDPTDKRYFLGCYQ